MTNKKNHVAIFVSTLNVGGAEQVAVTLANEMAARGICVDLVVMNSAGALRENLDSKVQVFDFKTDRGRFSFFSLVRYIFDRKPNAILSLLTVPNILLGLTKLVPMRNRPLLIGSEHSFDSDVYRRDGRQLILFLAYFLIARVGYRMLDVTVAVSEGVKCRMLDRKLVERKCLVVIPNPINLQKIARPVGDVPPLGSRIELLAVGRLDSLKDYGTMFRAVSLVKRDFEVELNVLGEGIEREYLTSLIKLLDLEKNINLRGNVLDTSTWYQGARVLVLSSIREGFGNVIVEALAHGVPVVSTDCLSGPSEILTKSEYGELVPVGDYEQLAKAIILVARKNTNPELLRLRADAFDSRIICTRYLEVLQGSNYQNWNQR